MAFRIAPQGVTAPAGFPSIGVLCVGRSNDFAYGADVPVDVGEAVQALKLGHARPLDVGWLKGGDYPDGRYFGNGIGIESDTIAGLDAAKPKTTDRLFGAILGAAKGVLICGVLSVLVLSYTERGAALSRAVRPSGAGSGWASTGS